LVEVELAVEPLAQVGFERKRGKRGAEVEAGSAVGTTQLDRTEEAETELAEQVVEQAAEQAADRVADRTAVPGVDAQLEAVGKAEPAGTEADDKVVAAEAVEIAAEVVVGIALDKVLDLVDYTVG
jgi:cytolysin (calcineurin-like family phosphatase)